MKKTGLCLLLTCLATIPAISAEEAHDVQATTSSGDQVILHANGRWEYMDAEKASQAAEIAKQFPENQGCPPGTQGGLFGYGRCIPIGDKDFNRGSHIGKGR